MSLTLNYVLRDPTVDRYRAEEFYQLLREKDQELAIVSRKNATLTHKLRRAEERLLRYIKEDSKDDARIQKAIDGNHLLNEVYQFNSRVRAAERKAKMANEMKDELIGEINLLKYHLEEAQRHATLRAMRTD